MEKNKKGNIQISEDCDFWMLNTMDDADYEYYSNHPKKAMRLFNQSWDKDLYKE